jgi:ATP-dependent 26S proteasome regulatory subunit
MNEFLKRFLDGVPGVKELIETVSEKLNGGYFEALRDYKLEGDVNHRDIALMEFLETEEVNDLYTFTLKVPMFINEKFYNVASLFEAKKGVWDVANVKRYYRDGEETDVSEIKIKLGPDEEVECLFEACRFVKTVVGPDTGHLEEKRFVVEVEEREAAMKVLLHVKFYAKKEDKDLILKEVIPAVEKALAENIFKNKVISIGASFEFMSPVQSTYVVPDSLSVEVDNIAELMLHLDQLKERGLKTSSGMILYGPPGTGKTSFLRHIINTVYGQATVFQVTAKGFNVGTLVGVYELARELAPSIIMFEDLDLIAKDRESGQFMGIMNELLNLMDGHVSNTGVVTLATTNFIDDIDKALTDRPGRFDRKIKVDYPTKVERYAIFEAYLGEEITAALPEGFVKELVDVVDDKFTNDHLREVVEQAKLLSYREDREQKVVKVERHHLERALEVVSGQSLKKNTNRLGFGR